MKWVFSLFIGLIVVLPGCRSEKESAGKAQVQDIGTSQSIDFTLKGLDGKVYRLSDYRGKVVLLDFWASWCGPCRLSMPYFEKLYQDYREKGFIVLGIGLEENPENLKTTAEKIGVTYPILLGSKEIARLFEIRAIPTTFLVGPDGRVVMKHVGFSREVISSLEEKIKELTSKNAS